MPPSVALVVLLALIGWLYRRHFQHRPGLSAALWIPTLWLMILGSRPVSSWFGAGLLVTSTDDYLQGSPVDRTVYLSLILAGAWVLLRRPIEWGNVLRENRMLFLLYLYLLVTMVWSDFPLTSAKRLFKDFGSVIMVLVILSDKRPLEAFRAVFERAAFLLFPLSVLFIKYFPDLGRAYSAYGGMMTTGVAPQKNALGILVMICSLSMLASLLDRRTTRPRASSVDGLGIGVTLLLGGWLLQVSDSKTSMVGTFLGAGLLLSTRIGAVRRNPRLFVHGCVSLVVLFGVLQASFGIYEYLLEILGRDATLTGRTMVWEVIRSQDINPLLGTGYCSFWSSERAQAIWDEYWHLYSAHNGYLEMFLDGGLIGVGLLLIMLLTALRRISHRLSPQNMHPTLRFVIVIVAMIHNISESTFGRLTPLWFTLLLCVMAYRPDEPDDEHLQPG